MQVLLWLSKYISLDLAYLQKFTLPPQERSPNEMVCANSARSAQKASFNSKFVTAREGVFAARAHSCVATTLLSHKVVTESLIQGSAISYALREQPWIS